MGNYKVNSGVASTVAKTNFDIAYDATDIIEGGWVNNSLDRGGETWAGISRKWFPNWPGWKIIDRLKSDKTFPKNLTGNAELQMLKKQFYNMEFWNSLRLGEVKRIDIASKIYDMAVNMGKVTAVKYLQTALNLLNDRQRLYKDLPVTGKLLDMTLAAINKHPRPDNLFKALNVLQGSHYLEMGKNSESQEAFMNGWFSQRIASVADPDQHSDMA
ncbi:MAG: glycosyl hydrolase 108 family protein [Chitinophagaceae bacterium]